MSFLVAALAISLTSLPPALERNAKTALEDVNKAKTALDAGKPKTSESLLAKAESLLHDVLQKTAPGSTAPAGQEAAGQTTQPTAPGQTTPPATATQPGASAEKGGAAGLISGARSALAAKAGVGALQDAYEKVTAARSLLKIGDQSKAKSLLDQIPTNASGILKSLGH